jgi:hypothetical protein
MQATAGLRGELRRQLVQAGSLETPRWDSLEVTGPVEAMDARGHTRGSSTGPPSKQSTAPPSSRRQMTLPGGLAPSHCQAVMIAFSSVHRRSVCRMSCGFDPPQTPASDREQSQLQPELQPRRPVQLPSDGRTGPADSRANRRPMTSKLAMPVRSRSPRSTQSRGSAPLLGILEVSWRTL